MPNIRIRQAIERLDRELNRVGEHALQHSGIEPRDALPIINACEDIIKTSEQLRGLAAAPRSAGLDPAATYKIVLKSAPNPDMDEIHAPKRPEILFGNLDQVLRAAKIYQQGIGSGNWERADIHLGDQKVARISYNGRVWPPGPWKSGMQPLLEAPSWW